MSVNAALITGFWKWVGKMVDILIVEDNAELCGLLCDFLRSEDYTVSTANSLSGNSLGSRTKNHSCRYSDILSSDCAEILALNHLLGK